MKFHELKGHALVVHDGARLVAKARPTPHGYIMVAYGWCWTDPVAREPRLNGALIDPTRMVVKGRHKARAILKQVARTGAPS